MKQVTPTRFSSEATGKIAFQCRKGSLQKKPLRCLLDTNFILNCVSQKIDFFEELKLNGFQILIPEQVIKEIQRIKESNKKLKFKDSAETALKLLEKNKFKKIDLQINYVDKGILKYLKENPETYVATLDNVLKSKIKNRIIIREKKRLEII